VSGGVMLQEADTCPIEQWSKGHYFSGPEWEALRQEQEIVFRDVRRKLVDVVVYVWKQCEH
jgi:hypothetical protein